MALPEESLEHEQVCEYDLRLNHTLLLEINKSHIGGENIKHLFKNNPENVSRLSEQVFLPDCHRNAQWFVHFHQARATAKPDLEGRGGRGGLPDASLFNFRGKTY